MGAISSINHNYQEKSESNSCKRSNESHCFAQPDSKEFTFLIGSLEKLPEAAQKLFQLSKLYLTSESLTDREQNQMLSSSCPSDCADSQIHEKFFSEVSSKEDRKFSKLESLSSRLFKPLKQNLPLHCVQTFIQWRSTLDLQMAAYMCLPARNTIYLQPLNQFPAFITNFTLPTPQLTLNFFQLLQGFCQIFFLGVEVVLCPPICTSGWNVRSRVNNLTGDEQLCVNDFFPYLKARVPSNGIGMIGIISTDLYPEGYNFVLGEALMEHKSAVVSFGNYNSKLNTQSSPDFTKVNGQLLWKLFKTLSHEVCHLLGLKHCQFFSCAMNESLNVMEAMSQPLFLCPVCLRKVQHVCRFDVLERYRKLQDFLVNVTLQLDDDSDKFNETIDWLQNCISYLTSN
ncbi:hypothetical protein Btru_006417 [Bulinus truncatus]|nr:hypothetical protein Btru_006417 [Bulinus truncatus]